MKSLLATLCLVFSLCAGAQVREIPEAVKDAFNNQYPDADSVKFEDNLVNVHVSFLEDGERFYATYTNKGEWKQTEKGWDFSKLDSEVQDGFSKSKYANEWKVKETSVIYLPDGSERYRVKVAKNDVQKKYLFFDKSGRLIRDSLTI
ncbi:MAG: PepSY-like domain-containing protein [Flavisolibacter sp.]|jgi:hypothetical protein